MVEIVHPNGVAPVVCITGASSGIGRALALAWAKRGANLVISGRNEIALARVAKEVAAAPRLGAYAASKFALEALSMALRAEIASTGVRVVVIRPGPVDTPFRANSVTSDGQPGVRPPGSKVQTAEEIAQQTLRAVDA